MPTTMTAFAGPPPATRRRSIRLLAAAASASLWLAPVLASAQDAPPIGNPAPVPPDARAPRAPAAGPSASDEDLEAAVLGSPGNPPAPPTISAPPPPRPPVATPPPPARRPTATPRQASPWPTPAAPNSSDEPDARPSLAIELATSGLASGTLQGGLFLGARWPNGLVAGGAFDYGSSSLSVMSGSGASSATTESGSSQLRLSAGLRYPAIRTEDGRVELFIAAELGVIRSSREVPVDVNSAQNFTAFGPTAAVGPGLRLWVHQRIAVGYVARFRVTHLSGKSLALASTTTTLPTSAADDSDASSTTIALEGAFQLLGVF